MEKLRVVVKAASNLLSNGSNEEARVAVGSILCKYIKAMQRETRSLVEWYALSELYNHTRHTLRSGASLNDFLKISLPTLWAKSKKMANDQKKIEFNMNPANAEHCGEKERRGKRLARTALIIQRREDLISHKAEIAVKDMIAVGVEWMDEDDKNPAGFVEDYWAIKPCNFKKNRPTGHNGRCWLCHSDKYKKIPRRREIIAAEEEKWTQ